MLKRYIIERVYLPTETLGSWYDDLRNMVCKTMELPWRNNQRDNTQRGKQAEKDKQQGTERRKEIHRGKLLP